MRIRRTLIQERRRYDEVSAGLGGSALFTAEAATAPFALAVAES